VKTQPTWDAPARSVSHPVAATATTSTASNRLRDAWLMVLGVSVPLQTLTRSGTLANGTKQGAPVLVAGAAGTMNLDLAAALICVQLP
jgi:hypothetical protein